MSPLAFCRAPKLTRSKPLSIRSPPSGSERQVDAAAAGLADAGRCRGIGGVVVGARGADRLGGFRERLVELGEVGRVLRLDLFELACRQPLPGRLKRRQ